MTSGRAPRVAIVGVRRVRTGLGQFFAKHLVAHGATVPAFIASRPETIEEGRASLRGVGIDAEGFIDLDALLDAHPTVNALVIASPHATHRTWLDAAIGRGLHVLCEKPLVWGDPSPDGEAARLVDLASKAGLVLFENCPVPFALPAFDALHPDARMGGVRTFEMEMAPSSAVPREMLVDSMSHPLSVLQALAPIDDRKRRVSPLRIGAWDAVEHGRVDLSLTFGRGVETMPIDVRIRLRTVERQPRPLAVVVNGLRADRVIRMDDYSMSLAAGERRVPLADPMAALVGEFVRTVRDGEPQESAWRRSRAISDRLAMLREIVGSFPGP